MSVYFHGNFGLNRKYMAGVLKGLLANPNADLNQLAEPFGYRAPFIQKYKSWLQKTGILESTKGVRLSQFGKVIIKHDPGLESLNTQWFMHHQLVADEEKAEAWHFFIVEFLAQNKLFDREQLEVQLGMKLMAHSPKHFSKGRPMNKVISRKIIECYVEDQALGALNIIYKNGKGNYSKGIPKVIGPWRTPEDLMKAF